MNMEKEFKAELRQILEQATEDERTMATMGAPALTRQVLIYAASMGYLNEMTPGSYRLSGLGRHHRERMRSPRKTWLKDNYVALLTAVTALATTATAIASWLL